MGVINVVRLIVSDSFFRNNKCCFLVWIDNGFLFWVSLYVDYKIGLKIMLRFFYWGEGFGVFVVVFKGCVFKGFFVEVFEGFEGIFVGVFVGEFFFNCKYLKIVKCLLFVYYKWVFFVSCV